MACALRVQTTSGMNNDLRVTFNLRSRPLQRRPGQKSRNKNLKRRQSSALREEIAEGSLEAKVPTFIHMFPCFSSSRGALEIIKEKNARG